MIVVDCGHKYWGDGQSNPIADPNPRLQALIDAARRGASVRVLFDSFFVAPAIYAATMPLLLICIPSPPRISISKRRGQPGLGIHARMSLLQMGDEHWSAVESLHGSEISHKLNREVLLLVENEEIYNFIACT